MRYHVLNGVCHLHLIAVGGRTCSQHREGRFELLISTRRASFESALLSPGLLPSPTPLYYGPLKRTYDVYSTEPPESRKIALWNTRQEYGDNDPCAEEYYWDGAHLQIYIPPMQV